MILDGRVENIVAGTVGYAMSCELGEVLDRPTTHSDALRARIDSCRVPHNRAGTERKQTCSTVWMSTNASFKCVVWMAKARKRGEFRVAATTEAITAFAEGLSHDDHVVLEATFHTWQICSLLRPHVARVVVAKSIQVKAIARALVGRRGCTSYRQQQRAACRRLPSCPSQEGAQRRRQRLGAQARGPRVAHASQQRALSIRPDPQDATEAPTTHPARTPRRAREGPVHA